MPLWNESSVSCFKMAQPVTVASYYNKMGHVQPQKYAQFDTLRASHQPTSDNPNIDCARGEPDYEAPHANPATPGSSSSQIRLAAYVGPAVVFRQKIAVDMRRSEWRRIKPPFYRTLRLSGYQKGCVKRGHKTLQNQCAFFPFWPIRKESLFDSRMGGIH